MNAFRLDGEIALITGGGTGLGLAMATRMAQAGAKVVITGRREQPLKDAAAGIGPGVSYVTHDVADVTAAGALVAEATKKAGGEPTILVNNAGHNIKKLAVDTTEQEVADMLKTHVTGAFAL